MKNSRLKYPIEILALIPMFMVFACTNIPVITTNPEMSPEVSGLARTSSNDTVIYSIPATNPIMKVKLVSLGLDHDRTLHLRMYFFRLGSPAGEYLDPQEQTIEFPNSDNKVHALRVYANTKDKPLISLVDPPKQIVELVFPIPFPGHEFPFIVLNWRLHYIKNGKAEVVSHTERYDLNDSGYNDSYRNYSNGLDFPNTDQFEFPRQSDWAHSGWHWW